MQEPLHFGRYDVEGVPDPLYQPDPLARVPTSLLKESGEIFEPPFIPVSWLAV